MKTLKSKILRNKIYLIYDEYNPPVECDYGFIKEMIYLGFLYPLKKRNYKMFYIMLLTEVAVSSLIMAFIPFKVGIITCILMLLLTNILFAGNYNMIVKSSISIHVMIPTLNGIKAIINDDTATSVDRKSTRLNSSHLEQSRMPSSA